MAVTGITAVSIALLVLALLLAIVWANQREAALRATQVRADEAEARAATAEAVVTRQAIAQVATATALAYPGSPEAAVDRGLGLLLAAEEDPTAQRLGAVNTAFGPSALNMLRPEIEHLLAGGLHLGGDSGYELSLLGTTLPSPDQAQVRTRERWMYDERTKDDRRARCLVETSDQTYSLRRAGPEWQLVDIALVTSTRSDCSSP